MPQPKLSDKVLRETLEAYERMGSITEAARALGLSRNTFQSRMHLAREWAAKFAPPEPEKPAIVPPPPKPRVVVRAGPAEGAVLRVLAIGDAHDSPHLSKERFYWMGRHAAEMGADYVVSIGDWATLDSLNSHIPNESLLGKTKNPFLDDMQSLKESLGEFDRGLGHHTAKKRRTQGNHERRANNYEQYHPEMQGILTGEIAQIDADHGWEETPYGQYLFLGGVGFIHAAINRLNKTYGGKNAENTIANDAVFDHVLGHSHVRREHRAAKLGPSKHITVLNLGCALPQGYVEPYMLHGSTTGWWYGVHEILIQGGQITDTNAISMAELERRYG